MKTEIKTLRKHQEQKQNSTRFTVYVENNAASDRADKWFEQYGIGNLGFKCRAWGNVTRAAQNAVIEAIRPVLSARFNLKPQDYELHYSRKAGCPCGCSPGYVGKLLGMSFHEELSSSNVWMTAAPSANALGLLESVCRQQAAKLPAEIVKGNAQVAAEKLQAAAAKQKQDEENLARQQRWEARQQEYKQWDANASLDSASL